MQPHLSPERLSSGGPLAGYRTHGRCMRCGFCIAECPTHVLLGDEPDGPRARVSMAREMLAGSAPITATVVRHLDRCLSCLACTGACPFGVDHMHLFDEARARIEKSYARPLTDRMLRSLLAFVLPSPSRLRLALLAARGGRWARRLASGRLGGMLDLAPSRLARPSPLDRPRVFPPVGRRRMRVALLTGCAQRVLRPSINEATIRVLGRHGCEVVVAEGSGCCGALTLHLGREEAAREAARRNVAAWQRVEAGGDLDAVVVNASGCGTTVKDYGSLLAADPGWSGPAARMAEIARDVTEVIAQLGLGEGAPADRRVVAYHSACSLQHGQGLAHIPEQLLAAAGFEVRRAPGRSLCCGSAGTYNILQPGLARALAERAVNSLHELGAEIIATGNIGCQVQIARLAAIPVVHTVELLDWATGGPRPESVPV